MVMRVFPESMDEYRGRPIGVPWGQVGLRLAPYLSPWFPHCPVAEAVGNARYRD